MTRPPPFDLGMDEMIAGPDWDGELDVDPIFAITGLEEIMSDAPHVDGAYDVRPGSSRTPSMAIPGCTIVEVEAGVIALGPDDEVVGCYLSTALAVGEAWRGRGLGAELVLERLLRSGENPIWNLDSPQYSPGGLAAHRSAWRRAQSHPEELTARMDRIRKAERAAD